MSSAMTRYELRKSSFRGVVNHHGCWGDAVAERHGRGLGLVGNQPQRCALRKPAAAARTPSTWLAPLETTTMSSK